MMEEAIKVYLNSKVGGNYKMSIGRVLSKPHSERTAEENNWLVKNLLKMGFAKQRKFKDKDCRELAQGMQYQTYQQGEDVVNCGDKGDRFYIIVEGECQVWLPCMHESMQQVIREYLLELPKAAKESSQFFTAWDENGSQIREWDWVRENYGLYAHAVTFQDQYRAFMKKEARHVLSNIVLHNMFRMPMWDILSAGCTDDKDPIDQPRLHVVNNQEFLQNSYSLMKHDAVLIAEDSADDSDGVRVEGEITVVKQHQTVSSANNDACDNMTGIPKHQFEHRGRRFEFIDGIYFEHVSTMTQGTAFGELALQAKLTNGRRKATVRASGREALTECATIDNDMYAKSINKIDQKRINKIIDFLLPLSCFQSFSKSAIIKFSYFITKLKFKRGHLAYKQNDPCSFVYIVYKGEFQLKNEMVKARNQSEQRLTTMLGLQNHYKTNIFSRRLPEISDVPTSHKLTIYGPGCLVGDEDAFHRQKVFRCSLECYSSKGVLFAMKKEDFYRLLLDQSTLRSVKEVVVHKDIHREGLNLNHMTRTATQTQQTQSDVRSSKMPQSASDISVLKPVEFISNQVKQRQRNQNVSQSFDPHAQKQGPSEGSLLSQTCRSAAAVVNNSSHSALSRLVNRVQSPVNQSDDFFVTEKSKIIDHNLPLSFAEGVISEAPSLFSYRPGSVEPFGKSVQSFFKQQPLSPITNSQQQNYMHPKQTVLEQAVSIQRLNDKKQRTQNLHSQTTTPSQRVIIPSTNQERLADFGKQALWSNKLNSVEFLRRKNEFKYNPPAVDEATAVRENTKKERIGRDAFSPMKQRFGNIMKKLKIHRDQLQQQQSE